MIARGPHRAGGPVDAGFVFSETVTLLSSPQQPLKLETRARRQVPNEVRPERNPAALRASVELWKRLRPRARLRSITAAYNCIGLVVACRRAWVDPEELLPALRDDGYRQLGGPAEAEKGDVVVYRDQRGNVCHAGIVVGKNVVTAEAADPLVVLSKWGEDGEYEHESSDVPELLGKPVEFWTDRKEAP
jgi:hypothetical protein